MQDNIISVNIEIAIGEEPISLIGKQLSIILASTTKGVEKITDWTIDEEKPNVIKFDIKHNIQDYKGIYKILVYENEELIAKTFIRFDHSVWHIIKDNGEEYDTIIYPDTYKKSGYSATHKCIPDKPKDGVSVVSIDQIEESTESLGQNIIRVKLSNEEYFDFIIRNGARGQKGDKPEKGIDYFTESEKQSIITELINGIADVVEEATEVDINDICV